MAIQRITAPKMDGSISIPIRSYLEAASQTFAFGDVLIRSTNYVALASNSPTSQIAGIALQAASGTVTTARMVTPALPSITFEATIATSSTEGAIALTDLWAKYPLTRNSAGKWYINKTDNSAPCVRVIGFRDAVGTTHGRVYFQFLPGSTIYHEMAALTGTAARGSNSVLTTPVETVSVTVTGAALGDYVIPSYSISIAGVTMWAAVTSANTVTVYFVSNQGTIVLGAGTVSALVLKVN